MLWLLALVGIGPAQDRPAAASQQMMTVPVPRPLSGPQKPVQRPNSPAQMRGGRWVTEDDYPATALREHMQGSVGFVLDVDADGMPTACTVTRSSGWPILDTATCTLSKRRVRFLPATDKNGVPIASTFQTLFRWKIPSEESVAASWIRTVRFTITPDGAIGQCVAEAFGTAPPNEEICEGLAELDVSETDEIRGAAAKAAKKPVKIALVERHNFPGSPQPGFTMPEGETIYMHDARFTIGGDGYVRSCNLVALYGKRMMRGYTDICVPSWTYPKGPDADAIAGQAAVTVTVLRLP